MMVGQEIRGSRGEMEPKGSGDKTMHTTTLSFSNIHHHGELFVNLLRARRETFIERNDWALVETEGMEYDQYDTPASRWVVVHDGYHVHAGMRMTPTTAKCGIYSYMIKDAQQGLLESIPDTLFGRPAPVDDQIWECSRMFVNNATPMKIRRRVHAMLTLNTLKSAREFGATSVLGLLPANWPRWASRIGCEFKAVGPILEIAGVDNQCVEIDLKRNLH